LTGILVERAGNTRKIINPDLDQRAGDALERRRIRIVTAFPLTNGNESVQVVGIECRTSRADGELATLRTVQILELDVIRTDLRFLLSCERLARSFRFSSSAASLGRSPRYACPFTAK